MIHIAGRLFLLQTFILPGPVLVGLVQVSFLHAME